MSRGAARLIEAGQRRPSSPVRGWPSSGLALFLALFLLCGGAALPAPARAATPERRLQEAARAYNRGEYASVIKLLRPLLHPAIRLSSESQVIQAYRLLGISYIFEKDRAEAEKQFMAILALQPDFRFDPLVDPVAAVEVLDELKRKNAEKLRAIRERERLEEERRRREEEARRRREEEARRLASRPSELVERTIVHHPYWVNFVPLGAGQFQNGHRRKGWALMGTQLGLGALSLATGISTWALYSASPASPSSPDKRKMTPDEYDRYRALSITQVVSGALCAATVVYGIIDALVHHRPQTVRERRVPLPPPSPPAQRLTVMPLASPGGAAVKLGVRF